ncbi:hypothetical protein HYN59_03910 [Flavobacterium album]|uniref:Uncharacterized protein n=1 Tax=Flavobacterium album TaxID=2175091 RepID=A0A2S1QVQ4_9FLAO|nr:hypothetical protein [Flavobacterium album]AWH84311.1 hypothetical protein HYN59_03910 [Flavobacterium album]
MIPEQCCLRNNEEDFTNFILYFEQSNVNENIKREVLDILPLLKNLNYDLINVLYEDLEIEFELIFFEPTADDSGKVIITFRDLSFKIYINGCKFRSEDFLDKTVNDILYLILSGEYFVTETFYNDELLSFEVQFMDMKKKSEYGLFNFYKKNIKTSLKEKII